MRKRSIAAAVALPALLLSTAVSPMERRVGRRHLAGLDDRAIAQELFLTPHAVRTTVGSLRERFGDDLARILDDGGRFAG